MTSIVAKVAVTLSAELMVMLLEVGEDLLDALDGQAPEEAHYLGAVTHHAVRAHQFSGSGR